MRVLFCGSKNLKDHVHIELVMAALAKKNPKPTLLTNKEDGVEQTALAAAEIHGFLIKRVSPGGAIQSTEKPDIVFAYVNGPLSQDAETKRITDLAIRHEIPTYITKTES